MTIITDPLFYALAIPAVVALGLSKGGFAGVGQMATPLLALAMPPLEAAAIMLPIMILQDASAVWVYRKDWSGRILAIVIPGGIIGIAVAASLAAHISNAAVRVFVGGITVAFVLYYWAGMLACRASAPRPASSAASFWGALSGFTSTLAQAGAPALPDLRAGAAAAEDDLRRHQRHLLRRHELDQGGALCGARPVLGQGAGAPRWCWCRWRS